MVTSRIAFAALAALSVVAACGGKVVVDAPPGTGGSTSSTGTTSTGTTSGGGGGLPVCNPSGVMCNSPPPNCEPGDAPSVVNGCWGPCVPILSCAPEPDCSNCKGFCAEYVGWTKEYRCAMVGLLCSSLQCGCLGPYYCVAPYDACVDGTPGTPGGPLVTCECTTC